MRSVANGALAGDGSLMQHGPGSTLGATVNLAAGGADITAVDTRPLVARALLYAIWKSPRPSDAQASNCTPHPGASTGKPRLPCMLCGLLVRAPRGGSARERLPVASTPCCSAHLSAAGSALSAMPMDALAQAHGVLMVVAWVFLLPVSVAVARTCKGHDPLWFQAHRALGVRPACPARPWRLCCAHCTALPRPALPTLRNETSGARAARWPRARRTQAAACGKC